MANQGGGGKRQSTVQTPSCGECSCYNRLSIDFVLNLLSILYYDPP
jgi:hypothetical protein